MVQYIAVRSQIDLTGFFLWTISVLNLVPDLEKKSGASELTPDRAFFHPPFLPYLPE